MTDWSQHKHVTCEPPPPPTYQTLHTEEALLKHLSKAIWVSRETDEIPTCDLIDIDTHVRRIIKERDEAKLSREDVCKVMRNLREAGTDATLSEGILGRSGRARICVVLNGREIVSTEYELEGEGL